jgi:hypothetical protein
MASSPEARQRWGRRGREVARERFAWRSLGTDWEAALGAAKTPVELVAGVAASEARS